MAENRGKKFEGVIREAFEKVPNTSIIRLPDPTNGYLGIRNISDFIVYHYPNQYFIECKSVHGNLLPFSNITENQWNGMLEMSNINGVIAGVICWWVDKDITMFLPIQFLKEAKENHFASIPSDYADKWILDSYSCLPIIIKGTKKRVFFDYDLEVLINELRERANS